jgi:hypothetical protein
LKTLHQGKVSEETHVETVQISWRTGHLGLRDRGNRPGCRSEALRAGLRKARAIVAQKVEATKAALTKAGFTVAGSYSPYANTTVIGVTNDELRTTAAKSEHGGYGAAMRVAVVKVKDEVQVSYTNPDLLGQHLPHGRRSQGHSGQTAGGAGQGGGVRCQGHDRGPAAQVPLRLRHGVLQRGPDPLVRHASHEEAVKAVEAGLAAGKQGVTKVYRVDVAGKKEVLFGVAMKGAATAR